MSATTSAINYGLDPGGFS